MVSVKTAHLSQVEKGPAWKKQYRYRNHSFRAGLLQNRQTKSWGMHESSEMLAALQWAFFTNMTVLQRTEAAPRGGCLDCYSTNVHANVQNETATNVHKQHVDDRYDRVLFAKTLRYKQCCSRHHRSRDGSDGWRSHRLNSRTWFFFLGTCHLHGRPDGALFLTCAAVLLWSSTP